MQVAFVNQPIDTILPPRQNSVGVSGYVADKTRRDFPAIAERCEVTADIFVLPSVCNDSFGIPLVEAMAAGAPVVANLSGGVVETVTDRETGFIVEKNDAHQLAQALLRLLEDDALRETMGRGGRKRALAYFTWDKIAETMLRRYRELSRAGSSMPTEASRASVLEYATAEKAKRNLSSMRSLGRSLCGEQATRREFVQ